MPVLIATLLLCFIGTVIARFRLEAFNTFNHAQFYGPTAVNGDISSLEFGRIVSAAAPRILQLGAKFSF